MNHPKEAYGVLFKSVWETLRLFGRNRHVTPGMIAVLHTWGQTQCLHPHLHCIVPGGGMDKNGKWKPVRANGKYLFPVKALSKVFRAKYVSLLRKSPILSTEDSKSCYKEIIESLFSKSWVVYAKRPFSHPSYVVEYLGRYTHKIAISNHRLVSYSEGRVRFSYKDYRHGGSKKEIELDDTEFIRRFALHILPAGFIRIRHYGILSSTSKKVTVPSIRKQLVDTPENNFTDMRKLQPFDRRLCPCCGNLSMITVKTIPRGPPESTTCCLAYEMVETASQPSTS